MAVSLKCCLVSPAESWSRLCGRDGGFARGNGRNRKFQTEAPEPPLHRRLGSFGQGEASCHVGSTASLFPNSSEVYTRLHLTHTERRSLTPKLLSHQAPRQSITCTVSPLSECSSRCSSLFRTFPQVARFPNRRGVFASQAGLQPRKRPRDIVDKDRAKLTLIYTRARLLHQPANVKTSNPPLDPNAPPRFPCVPRVARHVAQHDAWIPTHSLGAQCSVGRRRSRTTAPAAAADGSHRLVGRRSVPLDSTRPARCRATVADDECRTWTAAAAVVVVSRTPSEWSPAKRRLIPAADHHHFASADHYVDYFHYSV